MTWIPFSDRLPDDEVTVLVACNDANEPVWLGYHHAEEGWCSPEHMPLAVTHWSNLPEPPK